MDTPRSGSSRRKPVVTRKVIESEEDIISGDEDRDVSSPVIEYEDVDSPKPSTSKSPGAGHNRDRDTEEEPIDIDEHGNFILPEGTVVVEPEAVEDNMPVFRGPEFKSRKSRDVADGLDRLACTACNKQINATGPGAVKRHPVLKVLICKKCYNWYTSDEIDQDSNGIDEQCRWCGEGGNLICCDYCNNAFCKGCIKRNLGRAELSSIIEAGEDLKWQCYVCDQKPLSVLIGHCTKVLEVVNKAKEVQAKAKTTKPKARSEKGKSRKSRNNTSQSEDTEADIDIDESNAEDVLESLTATTQSMQMLLESMKEESESTKGRKKAELADKLRRSVLAFKKSVLDIGKSGDSKQSGQAKKGSEVNGGKHKHGEDTATTETDDDNASSSKRKDKKPLKLRINLVKPKRGRGRPTKKTGDSDSDDEEESEDSKRKTRRGRRKEEASEDEESESAKSKKKKVPTATLR